MQHRTEDTKVWALANTGTKYHAMLRTTEDGRIQAACRKTITRESYAVLREAPAEVLACTACVKAHDSYLSRVEASMEPATEADDLGYVHVETEQPEPITDYALPASLVDMVYEGTVIAEGAELIENLKQRAVTVRATAAGHADQARLLGKIAETPAARHQAARYARWAARL